MAETVKCLSTMRETWLQSRGWENSLEKELATHSSTLALKIPWTEELGAGYCPWGRVVQMVKNLPAMWETRVQSLGWEDPLENGLATHSSILAWRNPRTEEPGGLDSMGLQRVVYD